MSIPQTLLTTELIENRLQSLLTPKFSPTELRLSESGGCPRKRVARMMGLESTEHTHQAAEYFERGHLLESWVVGLYKEAFPRQIRTQVEVTHPYGKGHIDILFPAQRKLVEVKTANEEQVNGLPRVNNIKQMQAYMHFLVDSKGNRKADHGELVYVIMGGRLRTKVFPVIYDPKIGQEIEEEMHRLAEAGKRGELPEIPEGYTPYVFPCGWRNHKGEEGECEFWQHCWAGDRETIPAEEVPELAELLTQYVQTDEERKYHEEQAKQHKAMLDTIKEQINTSLDDGIKEARAGSIFLKRSQVKGRTTYDVSAAIKCGIDISVLEPFKKEGSGYWRFTVKQVQQ